ncbi:MAG: hypothetical protein A2202_06570 [Bdellovibrionales bacterium RIFOXYA1_FULL_36_14]|nr:MAG: hypothetical protein A2202_06570 [Bdellovibrionales bacterium RIFOXYA1_FULL_36_14]
MGKIIILIFTICFMNLAFCQDAETDTETETSIDTTATEAQKIEIEESVAETKDLEAKEEVTEEVKEAVKVEDTSSVSEAPSSNLESEQVKEEVPEVKETVQSTTASDQDQSDSLETLVVKPDELQTENNNTDNKSEDIKPEQMEVEVVLGVDKHLELDFIPNRQVQVGNRSVLDYEFLVGRKEITLKGLKPGTTNVTLRDNTDPDKKLTLNIKVTTNAQSKVLQDLQSFLKDIEGIEIKVVGDTITLDGFLVIPDDIGRILYILEKYPDIVNLVELSPQTQREVAKKMQEEIHAAGMRQVNVRIIHKTFVLEGVVSSNEEKSKASRIATLFLPDRIQSLAKRKGGIETVPRSIIQDFISVNEKKDQPPLPKLVKITAQFVELTKSFSDVFGFEWSPWLGGSGGEIQLGRTSGGLTTNSKSTLSAIISDLFPKLLSAQNAGHARVIQSSVLIVKEDVVGTIKKIVESVNPIGSGEFQKSQTSKGGYQLEVKPKILKDENIDLEIVMDSDTISGRSQEEIETLKNNIKTTLIVKSKESAVIGGVFDKKDETQFNTPSPQKVREGEGQKLFSFIRGKQNVVSKAQFVMFITPEIIPSASTGAEDIKKKFRRRK